MIAAVLVAQVAALGAGLAQPTFNAHLIDDGVVAGDVGYILRIGGWMLLVAVLGSVAAFASVALAARLSAETAASIRARVYRRAGVLTEAEYERIGTGSMLTRTSPDIGAVAQAVYVTMTAAVAGPIVMCGAIVLALRESVRLSPVIVVVVTLLGVGVGAFVVHTIPLASSMQKATDALNRVLREESTGVRIIRAFRRESTARSWFGGANDELATLVRRFGMLQALLSPGVLLVANVASVATVVFGAALIESGHLTIGGLTAYTGYLNQVVVGTTMLVVLIGVVPRAQASLRRIAEVLDAGELSATVDEVTSTPKDPAPVEFRGVRLRYASAEDDVLGGVWLSCVPGGTTIVIGGTSSGKSSLLRLVPRLIEPSAGQVMVSGRSTAGWSLSELRGQMAYVGQKQSLIAGTVESNLRIADTEADDETLWQALHTTLIADVVEERGGLGAPVDQGGANFSGGQRQRLALARAVIRRPTILCLDDAFSAMDRETADAAFTGVRRQLPETCVLLVTQRMNLMRHADHIAVLEHGRITDAGDHVTLMRTSESYREFVAAQSLGAWSPA